MTIVREKPAITGGVDTHSEVHVAAALDPVGGPPGTREFPATAAGYASRPGWLGQFGTPPWWAWRAPAATAPGSPGTWRCTACGSWRWTGLTGRTGTGTASPSRWMRSCRPPPGATHPCLVRPSAAIKHTGIPAIDSLDNHRSIAGQVDGSKSP